MTDQEFVELMDEVWSVENPDEDAKTLDESYDEDYAKFLDDPEDLEEDEEEE